MSSLLYLLGKWVYHFRRLVLIISIALFALLGAGAIAFNQGTDDQFAIPGTESQDALDSLSHTFPQVSGTSAQIIVVAPEGKTVDDPAIEKPIEDTVTELGKISQVSQAVSPFDKQVTGAVSDDKKAALISIQFKDKQAEITTETADAVKNESATLGKTLPTGSESSYGGEYFSQSLPSVSVTEGIGVIIALVVLFVTLGSFVAAGLPLLNAILGVAVSTSLIFLATLLAPISSTTPLLSLMLGLAVGIDYALFIISRHQEQLKRGMAVAESIAQSIATSGSAVIFAGLTVVIALLGLSVANIPFLTTMGVAAAVAVSLAVIISLTFLPALLAYAGNRVLPKKLRQGTSTTDNTASTPVTDPQATTTGTRSQRRHEQNNRPGSEKFFAGWVNLVTKRPVTTIVAVVALLGIASIPAAQLRLALPDAGSQEHGTPARTTYDLVGEHFGPGFNGPLIVTGSIIQSNDPVNMLTSIANEIKAMDGVAAVPLSTPNETADTGIIQVVPKGSPDSQETKALVQELRDKHDHFKDEYNVDLKVTGFTAVGIDVSDRLGEALLPFGILVVGLSLILLAIVFRSLWVPLKATLGYILSVGSAFGAVAAVFEWGWLAPLFGLEHTGPVISFMPVILMGVLFGLAMDYEVFLVSTIREDYVHGGDARTAVKTGFVKSAKVVTAAAIIMFSVFVAFVPEGDANIKPIALGLAVGVFVDAFIVRMTLVPAVLQLLGDRAWHFPAWLDRLLPHFDVEGESLHKELALSDWPHPGNSDLIVGQDLSLSHRGNPLYHNVQLAVPARSALVVTSTKPVASSALLLTLGGRAVPDDGILKVAGYPVPIRASAVTARSAYVSFQQESRTRALAEVIAEQPQLVLLDHADEVTAPEESRHIKDILSGYLEKAAANSQTAGIVIAAVDADRITELIPDNCPTQHLNLDTTDATGPESSDQEEALA